MAPVAAPYHSTRTDAQQNAHPACEAKKVQGELLVCEGPNRPHTHHKDRSARHHTPIQSTESAEEHMLCREPPRTAPRGQMCSRTRTPPANRVRTKERCGAGAAPRTPQGHMRIGPPIHPANTGRSKERCGAGGRPEPHHMDGCAAEHAPIYRTSSKVGRGVIQG